VDDERNEHLNAGFRVSVQSVLWTVAASAAAVVIGLDSRTTVLVALGAVGFVDALGSAALAHRFRPARRPGSSSDELERIAHTVVLVGLITVGAAAIVGGTIRLAIGRGGDTPIAGVVLAAVSFGVLLALSMRKIGIAHRVASPALRSDGHLSAIGAAQAGVAVVGTVLGRWLGAQWADAAATVVVGIFAVTLGVWTWMAR
jgi:divalent metal cation (Fe/Co/Zn/Cd) transporter